MSDNITILAKLLTDGHITKEEFEQLYQGLNKATPINIPYIPNQPFEPFGPFTPNTPNVPYIPNQPYYVTCSIPSR